MNEILFDRLAYMDRLKRAGITDEHSRAYAEALDEALRESVATKRDVAALRADITLAVRDMTIRMGAIAVALFAALTAIKFFA
jgi:hypothetical protein